MTNREIDALVAEKVMDAHGTQGFCGVCGWKYTGTVNHCQPAYSTDPAASKQLRDRMRELGWFYYSSFTPKRNCFSACFHNPDHSEGGREHSDTEEMAVALAILKALGVSTS